MELGVTKGVEFPESLGVVSRKDANIVDFQRVAIRQCHEGCLVTMTTNRDAAIFEWDPEAIEKGDPRQAHDVRLMLTKK